MNSIIDIADSLASEVMENSEFDGIKFLKAYGAEFYDPSYENLTAVVNIEDVERSQTYLSRLYKPGSRGDVFSAKLTVRIYGGSDISGYSLTRTSMSLCKAFINADSSGFICESKITPIKYENDTGAVYREIILYLEYVLCEAVV